MSRTVGLLLTMWWLAACGAKTSNDGTADAGIASDAAPADAASCTGDSDCGSGMFCSGALVCIADGTCDADADCMPGFGCGSGNMCITDGCGGTQLNLTYVTPNFIIVLDRSCSMKDDLDGTQTSKWTAAVTALGDVLSTYATTVRWGATLFPDTTGDVCAQDAIPFPIADNNAAPIAKLLTDAESPDDPLYPKGPCVTNIDTGMEQAATDPGLADPNHPGYAMLVTDGAQAKCSEGGGADGATKAIAALLATQNVKTFVVGFGSEVNADELNKFAAAGGEALTGTTKYYQADTAADLDKAFQTIAGLTGSCEYKVDPAPTDLDETWVYFSGNQLVARDPTHVDGWDYNTVNEELTFYGPHCDVLQNHTVTQVNVIFGCPTAPLQ